MSELKKEVESLIKKAEQSAKSDDALKFSQAACNAANAMCSLEHARKLSSEEVGNGNDKAA